jgi:hypothetical protein
MLWVGIARSQPVAEHQPFRSGNSTANLALLGAGQRLGEPELEGLDVA